MSHLISNTLLSKKTEALNLTLELLKGLRTGELVILIHTKFIPLVSKLCVDVSYQKHWTTKKKTDLLTSLELVRQDLIDRLECAGFVKKQASLPDDQNTWTKNDGGCNIDITVDPVRYNALDPFIRIIPSASPAA